MQFIGEVPLLKETEKTPPKGLSSPKGHCTLVHSTYVQIVVKTTGTRSRPWIPLRIWYTVSHIAHKENLRRELEAVRRTDWDGVLHRYY